MAFCASEIAIAIEHEWKREKNGVNVIKYSILKYICGYRIVPISKVNQLPFGDLVLVHSLLALRVMVVCLCVCVRVCVRQSQIDTFNKIFIILHIDFIMETCQFIQLFLRQLLTLRHTHVRVSVFVSVCVCLCA